MLYKILRTKTTGFELSSKELFYSNLSFENKWPSMVGMQCQYLSDDKRYQETLKQCIEVDKYAKIIMSSYSGIFNRMIITKCNAIMFAIHEKRVIAKEVINFDGTNDEVANLIIAVNRLESL